MNQQDPPSAPTQQEIEAECRPPALRFSKAMVEHANRKYEGFAPFWCPLIAAFTLQNVIIISMLESMDPGSDAGTNAINTFFDKCKFEVTAHWRSDALKNFGGKKKSNLVVAP